MADEIAPSVVTPAMAAIVGEVMRESVSHPVSVSDIRKWAIAVYYPDDPPRLFWDEEYAATTRHGGIVAPEEFNPFAWATQKPSMTDPKVAQTAFSEDELGVKPPEYTAMLMTAGRDAIGPSVARWHPGGVACRWSSPVVSGVNYRGGHGEADHVRG